MDHLTIRNVKEKELELVASILAEGALWLREEGMEMWTEQQISPSKLLQNKAIEEWFIGFRKHEPVAVMSLQTEDPMLWSAEHQKDALFLHKLCIRRKFAKTGLSQAMVNGAVEYARSRGKRYARLDCAADRPKLCAFYESLGFRKVREQVLFGKYPTAFYELEIL